jgi:hypothetical protein
LRHVAGDGIGWLPQPQFLDQLLELLPILRCLDCFDTGTDDGNTGGIQGARQIERCLSTELDDHAAGLHAIENIQDVFGSQRLKK